MLLAIDAGNTQTVIGLFDDKELADHWRIATVSERTSDELALMFQQFLGFHGFSFDAQVTGVAIASGVPRVTAALRLMTRRYFGFDALVVEPGVRSGIQIAMDALFARAAALRRVELVAPKNVIGKSTMESVQSGAVYGFTGQVDALVERFQGELGDCSVVATGGLAELILPFSRPVQHNEPWLTLHGLRIVFERNR